MKPIIRYDLSLAAIGLIGFAASVFAPAFWTRIMGTPTVFQGTQALASAVLLAWQAVIDAMAHRAFADIGLLMLGTAGLLNAAFIAAPITLLYDRPAKWLLWVLGAGSATALLFAAGGPFLVNGMTIWPMCGYFIWLAAHGCVLAAMIIALRQAKAD